MGIYRHFKGKLYYVTSMAIHTETEEELVIYHPIDDWKKVFARPKNMFFEEVEVNGEKMPRFEFMGTETV